MLIILAILIMSLFAYVIFIYNHLIALRNHISKNWSNIEVSLKQRYSEVPKLIDTCKTYMQYESSTLEKITQARNHALAAAEGKDISSLSQAEANLHTNLNKLFALAENYPELKANQSFLHLQQRISSLESEISDRREFYNESVNKNNTRIQQFPECIIAKPLGFGTFQLLEFTEREKEDVKLNEHF